MLEQAPEPAGGATRRGRRSRAEAPAAGRDEATPADPAPRGQAEAAETPRRATEPEVEAVAEPAAAEEPEAAETPAEPQAAEKPKPKRRPSVRRKKTEETEKES